MSEKCFICDQILDPLDAGVTKLQKKGIESLLVASQARGDNKGSQVSHLSTLKVHTLCRKNYTRLNIIKADLKKQSEKQDLLPSASECDHPAPFRRSALETFDFKIKCLFCTEDIDDNFLKKEMKKPIERRKTVYHVRTLGMKNKIMNEAFKRKDKWAEEVKVRLSTVSDLVAAEGVYHLECFQRFFTISPSETSKKRGRPEVDWVSAAMDEIYSFLENAADCQLSFNDLKSAVTGIVPTNRTIKTKLEEKYGERIIIATSTGWKNPTVCFSDTGFKILSSWYENKKMDETEERIRIVKAAAYILKRDIQLQVYDTTIYPPADNFFKHASDCVPQSLQTFLDILIMKNTDIESRKRKCISIAHSIISAVRPKSFISSIMSSLSLFIYRRFGSKKLVNLISSLGFCSSYHEAQVLELSAIQHTQPDTYGSFNHFVFDNADFNVRTLDGLNTFHAMGGIRCVSPFTSVGTGFKLPIPRLTKVPLSRSVGELGVLPLEIFQKTDGGLKNVFVEDLAASLEGMSQPKPYDTLWLAAKWLQIQELPGWKGYMHSITKGLFSEKTKIIPVPFINSPPSDYNTIFTALHYASEMCEKLNQKCLVVTFDQPLYIKSREIVGAAPPNSQLSKCIIRLGGFHLLMSYIRCIGFLMSGSGLQELMSTIYAPVSVEKMLQGKAFSRAVRALILIHTSLSNIIMEEIDISVQEREEIHKLTRNFLEESPSIYALEQNSHLISISKKLKEKLNHLKTNGPTSALWIQFFNMITLLKDYIHSERSGDWDGHLACVKKMIPYFHASGHFSYAKSSQLYVQDMMKLSSVMTPEEFHKFTKESFFTIRRTDRFWTGVWSDMTIEQTLMRAMKSVGGLTRGRGITDSVISKWVLGMTGTHEICTSFEEFTGVLFSNSEQHEDFGETRKARDAEDISKLSLWFQNHPPFLVSNEIISIASGIVGDAKVTCYDAFSVGMQAMFKIVGKPFSDVKLSQIDRALPLASMTRSVTVQGETIVIDPLMIFQRISISKQTDDDLKTYLKYELAPFPLSLFDELGMRKTKKSALYDIFDVSTTEINFHDFHIVVDGGYLLHKVVWPKNLKISTICQQYVKYILKHYSANSCTVVFDGYSSTQLSTKRAEQNRRYQIKKSVEVQFDEETFITVKQEDFLSNEKNKSRLIFFLIRALTKQGIQCREATDDADTLIIQSAIEKSKDSGNIAVIGEDIDLVVLLVALTPPERKVFFIKPSHGKNDRKIFCSQDLQNKGLRNSILFLHAFSGCDTTSASFRKGKLTSHKLFIKHTQYLQEIVDVFNCPTSSHEAIAEAGIKMFLKLYGAPVNQTSLNLHRYYMFTKSVSNVKPDIAALPPTEGAAKQHAYRVYHQVQLWMGNKLPPENWGWRIKNKLLFPVTTEDAFAPDSVLKLIFCKCTTGCGSRCGCRKAAMNCTDICHSCHGECLNGTSIIPDEETEDSDDFNIMLPDESYLEKEISQSIVSISSAQEPGPSSSK